MSFLTIGLVFLTKNRILASHLAMLQGSGGEGLPPDVVFAFKLLAVVGTILGAIGGIIALFLRRYWDTRDRRQTQNWEKDKADIQAERDRNLATEASRDRLRDILYESLRWFEGDTQKRSIGISIVEGSWGLFPEFHTIWLAVASNQAVYLLTVSGQGNKAHEISNLRRIMRLLVKERNILDGLALKELNNALRIKIDGFEGGLSIDKKELISWQNELNSNSKSDRGA